MGRLKTPFEGEEETGDGDWGQNSWKQWKVC